MSTITTELAGLLDTVQRPGDFFAAGSTEIFSPSLEVEGIGPIALPLLPVQAEQLIAVAEQAPYGRGEETLVDTQVRRTWQIDAARIRIEGRHWPRDLEAIVKQAAAGLGVAQPVVAELYKLLVYDQGSFFVSHRDTEKASGMFATLIIVLPSRYSGGELVVRHRDREVRLDLRSPEPSEVAFAAFYADCVHEVLPIASGCRLTLVYNLLLHPGKGRLPEPPSYEAEQAAVVDLLRQWAAGKESPDDDSPEKLIYPLEHAYTPAALAFDALKGADAAAASVLVPAAEQADCDLHLALVSIEESGGAEYTGYYGSRRRWGRSEESDDDFEIVEVCDRNATLSEWRRPDGSPPELDKFPFEEDELCPPDAFDDLEPDELHFHEATGNEGASFERTYRRAGLVLWPRGRQHEAGAAIFHHERAQCLFALDQQFGRRQHARRHPAQRAAAAGGSGPVGEGQPRHAGARRHVHHRRQSQQPRRVGLALILEHDFGGARQFVGLDRLHLRLRSRAAPNPPTAARSCRVRPSRRPGPGVPAPRRRTAPRCGIFPRCVLPPPAAPGPRRDRPRRPGRRFSVPAPHRRKRTVFFAA